MQNKKIYNRFSIDILSYLGLKNNDKNIKNGANWHTFAVLYW